MTEKIVNIKVTAEASQAEATMKRLHKITAGPNTQAVKQQTVLAKGNAKAQQQSTKGTRTTNTEIKQLQSQNKLLAAQNKLIQQNIRLTQQTMRSAQPSRLSRIASSLGITNKHGSIWSGGKGPGRGGGPGGGGPGGGGGGGGRGGGGSTGEWMMGGAAGLVSRVVGQLVHMVTSQIAPSDAAFTNYSKSSIGLRSFASDSDIGSVSKRGRKYGYSQLEGVQQMRGVARATGSVGDLTSAQAMSRHMGMDVNEVSDQMGMLTRSGEGGKGTRGERALQRLMSTAVSSGLDKSRAGEHLQAVAGMVEMAGGRTAGAVNASDISGLLAFFSKSGQAGLQGARGATVLSQIDQTVSGAGFGNSGGDVQALIMRAMGFGTGGNASFYDAKSSAQQGIFGKEGAGNLRKVFGQFDQEYGTGQGGNLAVSESFHLALPIVEQIRELIRKGGPNMDKDIAAATASSQPVESQILEAIKGPSLDRLTEIAATEEGLIEQGRLMAPMMDSITRDMNQMVHDMWPILLRVMDVVATGVSLIADFIKTAFRGVVAAGEAERGMVAASTKMDAATATGDEGLIRNAQQVYGNELHRIHDELVDAYMNPGGGTAFLDSLTPDGGADREAAMRTVIGDSLIAGDRSDRAYTRRTAAEHATDAFGLRDPLDTAPIVMHSHVTVVPTPGTDTGAPRHTARPSHITPRGVTTERGSVR